MYKKFNINDPMNCIECGVEFLRRAGNQKYCLQCSIDINKKKSIEKNIKKKEKNL